MLLLFFNICKLKMKSNNLNNTYLFIVLMNAVTLYPL